MTPELRRDAALGRPWLSIVGIGEDGVAGLGSEAQRLVSEAEFVFGGKRHLALAAPLIKGEARPWPSPFDTALNELTALRGVKVCVLASGDPFLHGVGATITRAIAAGRCRKSRRCRCTASGSS
jgi:precorrin-6Y C5,15-methyltransferase (decarboxylating)